MTDEASCWSEMGLRLGIEVIVPARLILAGSEVQFTALLPQFGGASGMIVEAEWGALEPHLGALGEAGYGYSCVTLELEVDPQTVAEMLTEWGWRDAAPKPVWLVA